MNYSRVLTLNCARLYLWFQNLNPAPPPPTPPNSGLVLQMVAFHIKTTHTKTFHKPCPDRKLGLVQNFSTSRGGKSIVRALGAPGGGSIERGGCAETVRSLPAPAATLPTTW